MLQNAVCKSSLNSPSLWHRVIPPSLWNIPLWCLHCSPSHLSLIPPAAILDFGAGMQFPGKRFITGKHTPGKAKGTCYPRGQTHFLGLQSFSNILTTVCESWAQRLHFFTVLFNNQLVYLKVFHLSFEWPFLYPVRCITSYKDGLNPIKY